MGESMNSRVQLRPHLTKQERLPQYLKEVEKIIRSAKTCQSNYKTTLANSRLRGGFHRKVYSLTVNVLKYYNYIQKIIDELHLLEKEKFLRREIASILIYEMIFGKNSLPGESKIIAIIRGYEKDIMDIHQKLQNSNFLSKEFNIPRYVRVHTLVTTVPYVIKDLESYGFKQIYYDDLSEEKYLEQIKNLELGCFLVDFHFKDILVFASRENLTSLDLYKNGHIFLQDKASYIPVHVLNPEPGCVVLDACAAPGMKTIHIASKMKNTGILIASERDKERFEDLKKMIQCGGVKICKSLCKDFKLVDPNDQAYSSVEYILLDPSCSGSGMVSRMDEVTDTEDSKNKERLMKLAGFQIILLKHALRFPAVKKVVYSTCSINEEENEYVVHEALSSCYGEFKLVPVMPEWTDRGSENFEFGNMCLRTVPEKHLTNGFFVAMFERVKHGEYRKEIHISKNKKMGVDTAIDTQYEGENNSSFKKQGKKRKWERSNEKKKINEISNYYFDNNSYSNSYSNEKCLLDRNKEMKPESFQEPQADNFKQNDSNSPPAKRSKKKGSASTSIMLNKIQGCSDGSVNKDHAAKESDFSVAKENKHFKKGENIEFSHMSNEVKQEELAYTPPVPQECLMKESNLPSEANRTLDDSSNIPTLNKTHKHKRHHNSEILPNSVQIDDKATELQVHKKGKKKEHFKNEISFSEHCEDENSLCVKEKKSKKHSKDSDFHSNELNSSMVIDNDLSACHNTSLGLSEKVLENLVSSSKHKNVETVPCDPKVLFMDTSIQNDGAISKKHKKKKHEVEKIGDFEIINESLPHTSESASLHTSIQSDCTVSKKNKKCKSKKHEIVETVPCDPEGLFMDTSIQNDGEISKKNKKHKRKKHEVEKIGDFETINESLPHTSESVSMCTSIQSDCAASKKNKKCKSKKHESKKTDDFKRNDEIAAHNLKETFMCSPIQNDCAISKKNKKCKSKKHKIEKTYDFEVIYKNLNNSESAMCPPIKVDLLTNKKSKKHKIEEIDDFKIIEEILPHNSESTVQSDCVTSKKNKKRKSKKHKIENTNDFEIIEETFSCNPEGAFTCTSIQNDCVPSKKVCLTLSSDEEKEPHEGHSQRALHNFDEALAHQMFPEESDGSKSGHSSPNFPDEDNPESDDPQFPGVTDINPKTPEEPYEDEEEEKEMEMDEMEEEIKDESMCEDEEEIEESEMDDEEVPPEEDDDEDDPR